jgi:hypothetical protein
MGEYPFLAGSGLYSERFMQEVPAQAKRLISEVVAQADYKVQRILLFGSRARGEALPDSDWDFFVITDCEPSPEEKRVNQFSAKGFCMGRGALGRRQPPPGAGAA